MADIDERFKELLEEFIDHRIAIKAMIVDLEEIKANIDRLIPKHLDARYMKFFEDKVKAVTALFTALLDMRKEIAKSVKDEIELRRKLGVGDNDLEDVERYLDIRKFADKVSDFQKKKQSLIKERASFDDDIDEVREATELKS